VTAALIIFLASGLFVVYVLAGYPLLLAWLARRNAKPVLRDAKLRPVSIVIAVRDGERWMEHKLRSVQELDYPKELMEVIVVSDGSCDRTEEIARGFAQHGVQVISSPQSSGKASALNLGIPAARNEILVLTDVRQDLDPLSLRRLIACFGDPQVGVASGDLKIRSGSDAGERDVGLYRRYESWIRARISEIDSMFGATGSYYAMRRELAVSLPAGTLLDDMYLPLAAFFRGYRLILEPTALAFDEPTALESEFSRKVRTLAGNWQILARYPALLGPRNRMLLHFLSHKFGRLMLPFALVAAGVSSFWLPSPLREMAWVGQGAFYGLALLHPLIPEGFFKRLCSPFRTFVVMMAAALCAPVFVFVPTSRLWKPTRIPARKS
jgi:cellulose synthase/poly-beta-1,6-N-acetylglucosamine synthase-like glycosyltransferase